MVEILSSGTGYNFFEDRFQTHGLFNAFLSINCENTLPVFKADILDENVF